MRGIRTYASQIRASSYKRMIYSFFIPHSNVYKLKLYKDVKRKETNELTNLLMGNGHHRPWTCATPEEWLTRCYLWTLDPQCAVYLFHCAPYPSNETERFYASFSNNNRDSNLCEGSSTMFDSEIYFALFS